MKPSATLTMSHISAFHTLFPTKDKNSEYGDKYNPRHTFKKYEIRDLCGEYNSLPGRAQKITNVLIEAA